MGIGMELPPNQPLLRAHPKLTFARNGYTYTIESNGDQSTYTVSDSSGKFTLPIRYAFGVHSQTFVLEYEGRFYESIVSYYAALNGLGVTVGDGKIEPHNLVEAMGRLTSGEEVTVCFGCHSTGAVNEGKLTLASIVPVSLASTATRAPTLTCRLWRRVRPGRRPEAGRDERGADVPVLWPVPPDLAGDCRTAPVGSGQRALPAVPAGE